jgi:thiol:disulfide interchange protein
MKKLAVFTLMLSFLLTAFVWNNKSDGDGINFQDLTLQQALKKAEKEGKDVFLDAYAVWCGPCKWMEANTFRNEEVGKKFNENFVSIKIDMEKGEGPSIAQKYRVRAYPTMFVLNSTGEVKKRILGAKKENDLLSEVSEFIK